ncbi:MAG: Gfo/Idh/MocA family oxidoreductase [Pelagibacteraceae bacterium]|jgi:myo-inositol 2-dehydrogenase / D-chiro-inositol 1-dehydrogenase|nr:Gfo/Idh/MocA family oxidoreductase [Pelagibacteraceae bacterium]
MINVALFGFGRIGQMHGENLFKHPKFNLKYVYDKDIKLAKKAISKFKTTVIKNYKTALKDKEIHVIFIASSTATHINFIREAAAYKKTIFCEKPLDLDLNKIISCKKYIKKFSPRIQIGFNRRYDPGHYFLKNAIDKKKIGILQKIIITCRDPAPPPYSYLKTAGGIFKDMIIHDFDLIRFYLKNDPISEVFATTSDLSEHAKLFKSVKDFEIATVVLKSKKGVLCTINNARHCTYGHDQRVEVFGTKGMLISNNKRDTEIELSNSNGSNLKTKLLNFFIERYKEAYYLQLHDLAGLVTKKKKPRADFNDGHQALILAIAAAKSLKLKKIVKIN